jgi:hypothetical protein
VLGGINRQLRHTCSFFFALFFFLGTTHAVGSVLFGWRFEKWRDMGEVEWGCYGGKLDGKVVI